jgi:hypothetical protein
MMLAAGQPVGAIEEHLHASLNTDDEATCRAAPLVYCSWIPKLPQLATEDSWRGEIVRGAWV